MTYLNASANILNTPLETKKDKQVNNNLLLTLCLKGVKLIKSLKSDGKYCSLKTEQNKAPTLNFK
ncbi:hypothetical protein PSKAS_49100 [Peribacillus sp. N1]